MVLFCWCFYVSFGGFCRYQIPLALVGLLASLALWELFKYCSDTNLSAFLGLFCLFTAIFSYLEPLAVAIDKEKWSMCVYSK